LEKEEAEMHEDDEYHYRGLLMWEEEEFYNIQMAADKKEWEKRKEAREQKQK
jgi:hypothetical protein